MSLEGVEELLLPAYVSDELLDGDRARVEAVLARSPPLRDEVCRYERLFVLLAAAEELEAHQQAHIAWQVALKSYLGTATRLTEDPSGAYGRTVVYYLGLG